MNLKIKKKFSLRFLQKKKRYNSYIKSKSTSNLSEMFHYGGSSIVFFTKDLYIMVHEYFLLFRNLIFFEGLNNMYSSYKNYLLIHSLVMLDILRFNQN